MHSQGQGKSRRHLCERVLSQNYAARTHNSRRNYGEAKPPDGIETEHHRESNESPKDAPYARRMCGNFPPDIDNGAQYLNYQRHNQNGRNEMGQVQQIHDVETAEIAED